MAAGLAAELKRGLNLKAELIEGGGGIFQVHLDGTLVFDKEKTGRQPAFQTMEAPTGIGRQLHGFRPRQQHAKTEGAEELLLGQPAVLIDDHPVHEGNLRGGPTEG